MNNQSIIKYKRYALLGILGTILFILGDWLLDVKPIDNITNGFVESGWIQMSMWHTFCNFLPMIFKIIYKNNGDNILTTNMVNYMAKYIVVPFAIYFVILELFTAIPFMYAILR